MLTHDCFLPAFIQLSQPASLWTSIGFYWDSTKNRMVELCPRKMQFHKVTSYIHGISVGSMLLQTLLRREDDRSKVLISSFGLIVLVFTTITVWVYHNNLKKCVTLINDLVKSSKEFQAGADHRDRELDTKEKFFKLMAPLFHWSAMSVPFAFVGGVVWSMPCMNSSFAFFLLEECSVGGDADAAAIEGGNGNPILKIVFIGINLVLWSYSIQCAVFSVIGVEMLGAMTIRSFLKCYEKKMLSVSTSLGQRANSKNLFKTALIYRRLQLLTDSLNEIHSTSILVPLLVTVSSHQVFGLYGLIKFEGQLNFVSYALFTMLASQGVLVIMGMFTALADVHTLSVRIKMNLEKKHRSHKWLRRFHAGCAVIKIRFGKLNYVDSYSPLSFESFAIAQTANMLLVD
ncbi:unnamed protein product [Orchesella dallaii]|uniref:Odorant receptor n=1 Tax=Orchesella dallaii TaxID=48710 RepID=A0ABP1RJ71_9HEXA